MANAEMLEYGFLITVLGMSVVFGVLGINWFLIKLISIFFGGTGKSKSAGSEKIDKNLAAAIAAAVRMYENDEKTIS